MCGEESCGYRFDDDAGRCPNCAPQSQGPADSGLGRLLADLFDDVPSDPPAPAPPIPQGPRLLDVLVAQEQVELEPGADMEALTRGVEALIAEPAATDAQAARLLDWLLDQPSVAEVYISDDDLSRLLEAW